MLYEDLRRLVVREIAERGQIWLGHTVLDVRLSIHTHHTHDDEDVKRENPAVFLSEHEEEILEAIAARKEK